MNINPQNASVLASLRNREQIRNFQQVVGEEQKESNPISNPNLSMSAPLIKDDSENQMASVPSNLQDPKQMTRETNDEVQESSDGMNYRAPIPQTVQSLEYDNHPQYQYESDRRMAQQLQNDNGQNQVQNDQNQELDDRGQDAIKQNRLQILYLLMGVVYIYVSINFLRSSHEMEPPSIDGESMPKCNIDSNNIMFNFATFILMPTLLLRIASHLKYRHGDPLDMHDYASKYIEILFHGSYGIWTIHHLFSYMYIEQTCKDLRSLSMVNYELAIILGCFSAVNTLFVGTVCIVLMPYICYLMYDTRQRNTAQSRRIKRVLKCLVVKDFDPQIFNLHHECAICLSSFEKNQKVIPLPCNKLHVFHEECIQQWISHQDICPLCKNPVTQEDCKHLSRNFDQVYPKIIDV